MFELENASLSYGKARILQPMSLKIERGLVTVVAGPNGAGKSSLLKLLSRDVRPTTGRVMLNGRALSQYSSEELAHQRAVLPQASELSFPFTVLEVVRLGLLLKGTSGGDAARIARDMLQTVDMLEFSHRFYHQLSGGERQRVHLARVLCQLASANTGLDRQFLLLDEPTSSLDLKHQIEVLRIAGRYAERGAGVLAILHDLNMSALFADRLIVLNRGRVAADGEPTAVITSQMVSDVFGVHLNVNQAPSGNRPFVLPHDAR